MRTVTATAEGRAEGVPDLLAAQVAISTHGEAAGTVMADNNRLTAQLMARLRELGVDERDVATASVDLGQHYDRDGRPIGYVATNVLDVQLRDLAAAGETLDALVTAGGDAARVNSISLGFADDTTLLSAARVDGVRRATAQATEMAEAAGATLGEVVTITDVPTPAAGGPMFGFAADAMVAKMASVPIAAGTRQVTVRVTVVHELT